MDFLWLAYLSVHNRNIAIASFTLTSNGKYCTHFLWQTWQTAITQSTEHAPKEARAARPAAHWSAAIFWRQHGGHSVSKMVAIVCQQIIGTVVLSESEKVLLSWLSVQSVRSKGRFFCPCLLDVRCNSIHVLNMLNDCPWNYFQTWFIFFKCYICNRRLNLAQENVRVNHEHKKYFWSVMRTRWNISLYNVN